MDLQRIIGHGAIANIAFVFCFKSDTNKTRIPVLVHEGDHIPCVHEKFRKQSLYNIL